MKPYADLIAGYRIKAAANIIFTAATVKLVTKIDFLLGSVAVLLFDCSFITAVIMSVRVVSLRICINGLSDLLNTSSLPRLFNSLLIQIKQSIFNL